MRPLPLALALLATTTLLVGLPASARPPPEATFVLDGVTYQYMVGPKGTGTMELEGVGTMPFEGCAFILLHPGTPNGRVVVYGVYDNVTPFLADLQQFTLPNGFPGYRYDAVVEQDGLEVPADFSAAGNATLRVGSLRYYDPVSSTGVPEDDREAPNMQGSATLLAAGVRDNVTGAVLGAPSSGDPEIHVRVTSAANATPSSTGFSFTSGTVPLTPSSAYFQAIPFDNLKLGGTGNLQVSATGYGLAGETDLLVYIVSPRGNVVANASLQPALLADDGQQLEFPLDEMGLYQLIISGQTGVASYAGSVTLAPPETFDLHLWWDNVTYGRDAYDAYLECSKAVRSPNAVVATDRVVARPLPPQFLLGTVAVGIGTVATIVLLVVKLVSDQVSLTSFRKSK